MRPEPVKRSNLGDRPLTEQLALTLLAIGGDQNVRVLEALAATFMNRAQRQIDDPELVASERCGFSFDGVAHADELGRRLELCRRIARRAVRGSLADPTQGATAFHRLDANPAWSRHRLPVATFGSFLFYKL